jgi:hypothetical protein
LENLESSHNNRPHSRRTPVIRIHIHTIPLTTSPDRHIARHKRLPILRPLGLVHRIDSKQTIRIRTGNFSRPEKHRLVAHLHVLLDLALQLFVHDSELQKALHT